MLPPGLRSNREVNLYYDQVYFDLVDSGRANPFIYPWATLGAAIVVIYLLVDHRQSPPLRWCRFPVFGFLAVYQGWCIATNRARNPAAAFGVGLISSWGTLWTAAIMLANDCQSDFQRIDRGVVKEGHGEGSEPSSSAPNGSAPNESLHGKNVGSDLRKRQTAKAGEGSGLGETSDVSRRRLYWQGYPSSPFTARLDWVADVFCSFRGVGWSFQTSGIPPPPKWVEAELRNEANEQPGDDAVDDPEVHMSRSGIRRWAERSDLLKHTAINLTLGYAALDVITAIMHRDPYFWGYVESPPPDYLPTIFVQSAMLTQIYRLLLSLSGVYVALWAIFQLGPALFCGVLGPRWIGVRGEPWMNPADMFGSYNLVLTKGLAGWWGGWWHQTFRSAFEAPATRLLEATGIDKHSMTGKALSLFVAFFLSGCLHASGSYTQLGDTYPLSGPFTFFMLQGVGILVQTAATQGLKSAGIVKRCPKLVCQATNFVLVHIWLYYTAPLLVDDFARGGVWLFEPIPFSPLRGLGLGGPDDQFFAWWHGLFWWRSGQHWWDTGIAL